MSIVQPKELREAAKRLQVVAPGELERLLRWCGVKHPRDTMGELKDPSCIALGMRQKFLEYVEAEVAKATGGAA